MRGRGDVAFTAGLGLVGLWMVYHAWGWPFSARLVPLAMGIPFLVLIALLALTFGIEARAMRGVSAARVPARPGVEEARSEAGRASGRPAVPEASEEAPTVRAYAVHGAWFGIFMLAVWVLGFPVGGTISVAAYLLYARSHWLTVVIITLGTVAFFWAAVGWMQIRFPSALLW